MERYEAKRAVIIGGTSGMGLATAKMLLDGGGFTRRCIAGFAQLRTKAIYRQLQTRLGSLSCCDNLLGAGGPGPVRRRRRRAIGNG